MKIASPKRGGPTPFGWFQIALAFGFIASGLYEVLPIIDTYHASGTWWHNIVHVIVLTKAFRLFCCLILVTYGWRICGILAHLAAIIGAEPLVVTEYVVVLALIVGILLLVVAWYRTRASPAEITKDAVFALGSTLATFSLSLMLGVSIGQARTRREDSQRENALRQANEELIGQKDAALEKIRRLHLLIRRLPNPPKIPLDLNP